jgi:beta-1,4-N-acetylglucosaminyltransferase
MELWEVSKWLVLLLVLYRIYVSFPGKTRTKPRKKSKSLKTMIVLGSGGHTAEMFRLLRGLNPRRYHPRHYVKASGDNISASHFVRFEEELEDLDDNTSKMHNIPRAREVGQSYFTSIFTTINALVSCVFLVLLNFPDVVRESLFLIKSADCSHPDIDFV